MQALHFRALLEYNGFVGGTSSPLLPPPPSSSSSSSSFSSFRHPVSADCLKHALRESCRGKGAFGRDGGGGCGGEGGGGGTEGSGEEAGKGCDKEAARLCERLGEIHTSMNTHHDTLTHIHTDARAG